MMGRHGTAALIPARVLGRHVVDLTRHLDSPLQQPRTGDELHRDDHDGEKAEEQREGDVHPGGYRRQGGAEDPGKAEDGEERAHETASVGELDGRGMGVHRRVDGAEGEADDDERGDERGHGRAEAHAHEGDRRERPEDPQDRGAADPGKCGTGCDAPQAGNDGDESEEEGKLPLLQGEGRLDRRDAGDERGEAQPLSGVGDGAGPPGSGIGVGHVRTIAARERAEAANENGTPPEGGVPSARTKAGARRIGDLNP